MKFESFPTCSQDLRGTALMIDKLPLQSHYEARVEDLENSSELELAIHKYLSNQSICLKNLIDTCAWHETLMSAEKTVENWKYLLTLTLLNYCISNSGKELAAKVRLFEQKPWNQDSQYFRILVALNHALTKMSVPEVGISLLESGAALIDLQEYSSWQAFPYIPHHLEFGIYLSILVYLTKRDDLKKSLIRLGKWQLNTLDANYKPLTALFVREQNGDPEENLLLYYLFFHCLTAITEENEFISALEALSKQLKNRNYSKKIHPLWILIESFFKRLPEKTTFFTLPEHIYDPSTSLVGYRSSNGCTVCTLHGGRTGLGCIKLKDVEIVNFGPQYLPLSECLGFGIEGNHLSDHGLRKSIIELKKQGFSLKGCTRLVDQPSSSPFQIGLFRGIWLEVTQELVQDRLNLKTTFLGLDGWEGTAFSFFAKAEKCRIKGVKTLLPGTLDRYEGNAQQISLESKAASLNLNIPSFEGTVQVIPLAGKHDFWGANFLIAYILHSDQKNYHWQIEFSKENFMD
ncbi:hypothetical protein [Candidatus Protochlamydia amoebophila]|uniref:Uncharacterized protein n=1 Tax=Candidatus Protochlamydia amoebophila TaxID=362787 RepID=A0A0C1JVV3_9BACT|nr:hypothetical protein [Candidatus Protochlamydia amoebophila]KIC71387.1 hypothetical protein DB44_DT00220 [Candidatus Protochlamydia amoebophila]